MRVAIIGAGWFGCHIGNSLLKKGIEITIYDKNNCVFGGASKYNTGRLHLGFHYPRSSKTRKQSKYGFTRFVNEYADFCEDIPQNLYLVVDKESLLDFSTYCSILDSEGLNYDIIKPDDYGFQHMEGGLLCGEKAVNPVKAAAYFEEQLSGRLKLNTPVNQLEATGNGVIVNGLPYDFCINCTYSTWAANGLSESIRYENIVTPLFKPTPQFKERAFVIMDGDFFSLNPYYTGEVCLFSLYHVKHSVVASSSSYQEALQYYKTHNAMPVQQQLNWEQMMEDVIRYYPGLNDELELSGSFLSIRTTLINENANRECIVEKNNSMINVLSGKINSIFEAAEKVSDMLTSH